MNAVRKKKKIEQAAGKKIDIERQSELVLNSELRKSELSSFNALRSELLFERLGDIVQELSCAEDTIEKQGAGERQ